MIEGIQRIARFAQLREKIVWTIFLLVICRMGGFIPVPGINGDLAVAYFRQLSGGGQNLLQLVDIFSGGAFSHMTVFALSVVPYISASIILQLVVALFPGLQREMRENSQLGRRKINRWTRLLTLALALFQSALFTKFAIRMNQTVPGVVVEELLQLQLWHTPLVLYLVVMVTMTTGTLLLMWIGEQISEKGIGNGISLIIAVGIVSSLPSALGTIIKGLNLDSQEPGPLTFSSLVVLSFVFVFVIIATILIIQGQRKIPLQYARRVVGRKEVSGNSAFIPLKINYAGVIPVIFASSVLMFPATVGQFVGSQSLLGSIGASFAPGTWLHTFLYVFLILFFTYFWTATQFHPEQVASDMKRNGAFIPGIRQGKPTQEFLEKTMSRITLVGGVFLAGIAILPTLVGKVLRVDSAISYFFGGTSILILVGVILDTMKQIDSQLLTKRYEGFMSVKKAPKKY